MEREIITNRIKKELKDYAREYQVNETTAILIIMTEVLAEISLNTENIALKMME